MGRVTMNGIILFIFRLKTTHEMSIHINVLMSVRTYNILCIYERG